MPADDRLLALITLTNPALLWGAAACAVPLVVHLFLRSRPRRQAFPALRFLLSSQKSSVREHRLRHLLLLALRMLLILLLATALARPVWRGSWVSAQSRQKTAAVFLIDDSASMGYRFEGRTRLERAREWVRSLIQDSQRFPEGSTFTVATVGAVRRDFHPRRERSDALRDLDRIVPGDHDRPLARGIDNAFASLQQAKLPQKELYVFTDMTRRAWFGAAVDAPVTSLQDLSVDGAAPKRVASASRPGPSPARNEDWADRAGVAVFVMDAGDEENRSARLGPEYDIPAVVPPRVPFRLSVDILAADELVETQVEAFLNGRLVARTEANPVAPRSTARVQMLLPAMTPGVYAGELRLSSADPLDIDDSLYFAVDVQSPPRIAVLRPTRESDADATEARRIEALLCPPSLPEDRRPFDVVTGLFDLLESAKPGAADALSGVRAMVLIDPNHIGPAGSAWLKGFLERGGRILIVPGDAAGRGGSPGLDCSAADYLDFAELPAATRIDPARRSPGDSASAAPGLEAHPGTPSEAHRGDPISSREIRKYARSQPRPGATPMARFENGDVAIWFRPIGRGSVLQWTFSLAPQWGDLGIRAAPAMTMLQAFASEGLRSSPRVANVRCGGAITLLANPASASAEVVLQASSGKSGDTGRESRRCDPTGMLSLDTRRAGLYEVRLTDAQTAPPSAACAVNLHNSEANGDRVAIDQIRAAFAPDSLVVLRDPAGLASRALTVAGDRELDGYLLLLLLCVLLAEELIANRFYRRQKTSPTAGPRAADSQVTPV